MSRQLKISEDVYQLLLLMKPSPETSFNNVILYLIEGVCPWLHDSFENLKNLEQESPKEAAAERILLQKDIFDEVLVELFHKQHERQQDRAIDKYLAERNPEQNKANREHIEKYRRERASGNLVR